MKAIVTGGAGFIGSHLVATLVAQSWEVTVIDNLRRGRLANLSGRLRPGTYGFRQQDVRDYTDLAAAVAGADLVYHLAAESTVLGTLQDPDYAVTTNVHGTLNVLEAARATGVPRVVFASSREVYGEQDDLPVNESAALAAKNAYGASKVAGEAYCHAWQETFGLQCVILRFTNIYGPGDRGRVIPLWLQQARQMEDLTVYGGAQLLDLLWIGYAVDALVAAARCDADGPVNVGSGRGTPIGVLGARLLSAVGGQSRLRYAAARSTEVVRFVADVRRMASVLGVHPPEDPLEMLPALVDDPSPRDAAGGSKAPSKLRPRGGPVGVRAHREYSAGELGPIS